MVYGLWCMVYGLWFMVYGLWFIVYGLWFMVYGLWFMVYGLWFMVYGLRFKLYILWLISYSLLPHILPCTAPALHLRKILRQPHAPPAPPLHLHLQFVPSLLNFPARICNEVVYLIRAQEGARDARALGFDFVLERGGRGKESGRGRGCTSHITHHKSHITHHTSHITHHTSHITHHT